MTARQGGSGSEVEMIAEQLLQRLQADAVFVLVRRGSDEANWDVAARSLPMLLTLPDALASTAHQIAKQYHLQLEITVDGRPIYR